MVSVPAGVEPRLPNLDGDGIRVLRVSRHTNKLKPGHLHGNRFRIRIRGVYPEAAQRLPPLLDRLRQLGLPNFYGPQRFGRDGETLRLGLALLDPSRPAPGGRPPNPFLRKLALSAAQSALFNHALTCRMRDDLLRTVHDGDVMAKWPFGGMFVAEDLPREQARLEAREIVPAGPMFGRKMFPSRGLAAQREAAVLRAAGLTPQAFHGFGKLLSGTRRHELVYLDDLTGVAEGDSVLLAFMLPAGSYATVALRELTRDEGLSAEEAD
jgi:tRNA pseudouridine13 synthase